MRMRWDLQTRLPYAPPETEGGGGGGGSLRCVRMVGRGGSGVAPGQLHV